VREDYQKPCSRQALFTGVARLIIMLFTAFIGISARLSADFR
jgi:hypothetical protein